MYLLKSKRTLDFIKKALEGKLDTVKVKYGTREKAAFVYGVNRQAKNGKIYQYAVDFNGTKKLVKVIG